MAEIEITLPTVQYGNVRVRATPEELGVELSSPAAVGTATAIYLNLFTQGFRMGASMDVTASPVEGLSVPESASREALEEEARELLDKGLGGVTEVQEGQSVADSSEADAAPWNKTPAADVKPKPWETSGKAPDAPAVAKIDW